MLDQWECEFQFGNRTYVEYYHENWSLFRVLLWAARYHRRLVVEAVEEALIS